MRASQFSLCLLGASSFFFACNASYQVGEVSQSISCTSESDCSIEKYCSSDTHACVRPPATKDIDVLFVIDNSPSMTPLQAVLARSIPKFIRQIESTGADYHIGIVSSDVGATASPGSVWSGSLGSCNTYEGDDGVLQNLPCSNRSNLSAEAVAACNKLCPDSRFVPIGGQRYISKTGGVTNVPTAMAPDPVTGRMVDYGPQKAFQCMALLGDGGCGIEGQLEGAQRALDGHRLDNDGFLRPNSMLAVIFITDEDDCSIKLTSRAENDPQTMDCAPDSSAPASCFNIDYRCLARNLECDQPMDTSGTKTHCRERATSYLESVEKYVKFFFGLRPSHRLFISGIWTLDSIDRGGRVEIAYATAGFMSSASLNRVRGTCATSEDGAISGLPQLRLSKFARSFKASQELSLCALDRYDAALDTMASTILFQAGLQAEL